jgi:diguanylate cyclase (GGDEF)-like protein
LKEHISQLQRKARLGRRVGLCALLALGLIFGTIIVNAFQATAERRQAEALQVHTLDVLMTAARLETSVNEALRGERGYLITGDRDFLQPYFEGRTRSFQLLRSLRHATRDNVWQQGNLGAAEQRLRTYIGTVDRLVALEAAGRRAEAAAAVRAGAGRSQIIAFLASLGRVQAEERRLLALRGAEADAADTRDTRYNYIIAILGALMLALLAAAVLGAARAHRRTLELTEELERLATTDALTGLPNRRQLMTAMETEVLRAGRAGRPLSLALLDVDRFKAINDTHGHPVGDDVLRVVAEELRRVTRGGDLLGRFGGEEFAIIMPETDIDQAHRACERLRRAIARRILHYPNGTSGRVTVSSGVAVLTGGEGCDHLVSRADGALYQAKAGGRNLVRLAA